jgi:hypothetical protein
MGSFTLRFSTFSFSNPLGSFYLKDFKKINFYIIQNFSINSRKCPLGDVDGEESHSDISIGGDEVVRTNFDQRILFVEVVNDALALSGVDRMLKRLQY